MKKYHHFIRAEIEKMARDSGFISRDNLILLFNKDFSLDFPGDNIPLLYEIIISDQYHTKKFLKNDSVIIDAGANIGTFSVFAANLSPDGAVYSFEPVKKTFDLLKRNTCEYNNIFCYNSGLGDKETQQKIFSFGNSLSCSVLGDSEFFNSRSKEDFTKSEMVNITTIDAFVLENKIQRVDFIKIDTEGYEIPILKGAIETIKKWKPVIAMSAYHRPEDKTELPLLVQSISSDYVCELHKEGEENFLCYKKL